MKELTARCTGAMAGAAIVYHALFLQFADWAERTDDSRVLGEHSAIVALSFLVWTNVLTLTAVCEFVYGSPRLEDIHKPIIVLVFLGLVLCHYVLLRKPGYLKRVRDDSKYALTPRGRRFLTWSYVAASLGSFALVGVFKRGGLA